VKEEFNKDIERLRKKMGTKTPKVQQKIQLKATLAV
jgi:hypothetical protein